MLITFVLNVWSFNVFGAIFVYHFNQTYFINQPNFLFYGYLFKILP